MHYFPYDVKLRILAHSRSFLANQKARNAIFGAENLLNVYILRFKCGKTPEMFSTKRVPLVILARKVNLRSIDLSKCALVVTQVL